MHPSRAARIRFCSSVRHAGKTVDWVINKKKIPTALYTQNELKIGIICKKLKIEPSHEIMVLFVLRKLIPQTRMRSHPVGLDVWFLVGPFVYFHTFWGRTAKALARLRGCAGSPEPLLVAYMIRTITSWVGSNDVMGIEEENKIF